MRSWSILIWTIGMMAVWSQPASACFCSYERTPSKAIASVDYVFLAKVQATTPSPSVEIWYEGISTFHASQTFKGGHVSMVFHPLTGSCGMTFKPGKEHLVFAIKGKYGQPVMDVCLQDYDEFQDEILKYLRHQEETVRISSLCKIKIRQAYDAEVFTGTFELDDACYDELALYEALYRPKE